MFEFIEHEPKEVLPKFSINSGEIGLLAFEKETGND
jgi:hypothetical protein